MKHTFLKFGISFTFLIWILSNLSIFPVSAELNYTWADIQVGDTWAFKIEDENGTIGDYVKYSLQYLNTTGAYGNQTNNKTV